MSIRHADIEILNFFFELYKMLALKLEIENKLST